MLEFVFRETSFRFFFRSVFFLNNVFEFILNDMFEVNKLLVNRSFVVPDALSNALEGFPVADKFSLLFFVFCKLT